MKMKSIPLAASYTQATWCQSMSAITAVDVVLLSPDFLPVKLHENSIAPLARVAQLRGVHVARAVGRDRSRAFVHLVKGRPIHRGRRLRVAEVRGRSAHLRRRALISESGTRDSTRLADPVHRLYRVGEHA